MRLPIGNGPTHNLQVRREITREGSYYTKLVTE